LCEKEKGTKKKHAFSLPAADQRAKQLIIRPVDNDGRADWHDMLREREHQPPRGRGQQRAPGPPPRDRHGIRREANGPSPPRSCGSAERRGPRVGRREPCAGPSRETCFDSGRVLGAPTCRPVDPQGSHSMRSLLSERARPDQRHQSRASP
jgi:hypothetical protein